MVVPPSSSSSSSMGKRLQRQQRDAAEEAARVSVDYAAFSDAFRLLRPLAPGEREGDAALLQLTQQAGGATGLAAARSTLDRAPRARPLLRSPSAPSAAKV